MICRSKRLGGGFGGKEFQSNIFAVIACAAANKLLVQTRCFAGRCSAKGFFCKRLNVSVQTKSESVYICSGF